MYYISHALFGVSVCWLAGQLTVISGFVGRLVGWPVVWFTGWFVGWSANFLVGCNEK